MEYVGNSYTSFWKLDAAEVNSLAHHLSKLEWAKQSIRHALSSQVGIHRIAVPTNGSQYGQKMLAILYIHPGVEPQGPSGDQGSPAVVAEHVLRTRWCLLCPTSTGQAMVRNQDVHLPPFEKGEES